MLRINIPSLTQKQVIGYISKCFLSHLGGTQNAFSIQYYYICGYNPRPGFFFFIMQLNYGIDQQQSRLKDMESECHLEYNRNERKFIKEISLFGISYIYHYPFVCFYQQLSLAISPSSVHVSYHTNVSVVNYYSFLPLIKVHISSVKPVSTRR